MKFFPNILNIKIFEQSCESYFDVSTVVFSEALQISINSQRLTWLPILPITHFFQEASDQYFISYKRNLALSSYDENLPNLKYCNWKVEATYIGMFKHNNK